MTLEGDPQVGTLIVTSGSSREETVYLFADLTERRIGSMQARAPDPKLLSTADSFFQ